MDTIEEHVRFVDNSFTELIELFRQNTFSKVIVIVDENTNKYCYPLLGVLPSHHVIEIKSGEEQKNLDTCIHIWQKLTDFECDRHAMCINLGGGVIGDMGGFCASTYKRGIAFIQIPTTLLSMVDASVGGKLGIDFNGYKNHIGVFSQPLGVYINPTFLNTLDKRELRSGYAEIIKHCLINDASRWRKIQVIGLNELHDPKFDWHPLIEHSIAIKNKIVQEDPTETGLRKILNFGHTIGHAVESFFLPKEGLKLLHGEAIAVGMIAESYISCKRGFLTAQQYESICGYILSIFEKVNINTADIKEILSFTIQDKKNQNGNLKFSLLTYIGACGYDFLVTPEEVEESILHYISL